MPLITMPREMGSLGKDVAALVAQKLGKTVVHHEIADQLANKMRLRKSHVVRFLEGKAGMWEKMTTDQTTLAIHTADEIFRVAEDSSVAVIRGWGATHLLDSIAHIARVRVCAPFELRVERMMERIGTDDRSFAEKEIRLSDEALGAITRRHFDVNWKDAENYDLVLNTARVSVEKCADAILNLLQDARFQETVESTGTLRDLALAAHVRAALRNNARTAKLDITIAADSGRVTLSGILDSDTESKAAAEIIAAVPGVSGVNNELKTTTRAHRRFES
jgi:cytidylate kinase